jgi:aerobic carbon-monoxide dehydrogenase large subunit
VVERLVDRASREMNVDPVELRRRNFVPNDAYPYATPVALTFDSGDYFKTLDMAVKAADYAGFKRRQQEAAKRGKLRGIGICTYIEACAMAPSVMAGQLGARAGFYESAEVRPPHRQHHRIHRLAQPRPRSRDYVRPARV